MSDQTDAPESIPCVACGRQCKTEPELFERDKVIGIVYDGVVCRSYGNYGSTVYDPPGGESLFFVLCDQCLTSRSGSVWRVEHDGDGKACKVGPFSEKDEPNGWRADEFALPMDKAQEASTSADAWRTAIGGHVNRREWTLYLTLGTGRAIEVPLSTFGGEYGPSGLTKNHSGDEPDFSRLAPVDGGLGLCFGDDFAVRVDTIVVEHDFLYHTSEFEKTYERLLEHVAGSFGGDEVMARFRTRLKERLKQGS